VSVFTWYPRYAIGIASIDAQHIALFRSAQELHDAYRAGLAREIIPETLNHLMIYCMTHFEDEEAHMSKAAFPGLRAHQEEHRRLLARAYDLRERFAKGDSQVAMELSLLIARWLKKHIKESDRLFGDFIRQKELEA
jgi:hemerythrin